MVAFLDVTSAYDNVDYKCLIKKLIELECPSNIVKFVESWIYYRDVKFSIYEEKDVVRRVYKELPRGAVLSPMLYTLYTTDLMRGIDEEIDRFHFADDIAIYHTHKDKKLSRGKIEKGISGKLRKI